MNISLEQAISEANAHCIYQKDASAIRLTGGASDNRLVKEGDIFVCIKGNTVDGHDFAKDAMERGAKAILAEHNPFIEEFGSNPPIPVLLVDNSVKALGRLAHARRNAYGEDFQHRVIGITGTAGKTSLKELLSHILSIDPQSMENNPHFVAKNPYNNNTQIGMPIAILNARGDEKYWVLELGISNAHDMDELGEILQPDIAVILNVGSGHTEGLGEKGVAFHKASLLKHVKETGIAFVSKDYPELVKEASFYNHDEIIYFTALPENIRPENLHNTHQETYTEHKTIKTNNMPLVPQTNSIFSQAEFLSHVPTAIYLGANAEGLGQYRLHILDEEFTVCSPFLGSSGAENCLAAACVALALEVTPETIIRATASMAMPNMRFNRMTRKNWDIIDDCYNANPLSSARMLESAKELAQNKGFHILLGEMKELGEASHLEHVSLALQIAKSKVDVFFWVGGQKDAIQEGLKLGAFTGLYIPVHSPEQFLNNMKEIMLKNKEQYMNSDDVNNLILFKGSRSNYLEHYVKIFMEYCNAL